MAKKEKHATTPRTSAKRVRDKRRKSPASSIRVPSGTVPVGGAAPSFLSGGLDTWAPK
jgi:hypothetical protein